MLGKTNLTTVEAGTIVSDIADYSWEAMNIGGVSGTFTKAIYDNNMLVGITKDGTIAYTLDGENWESTKIDLEEDYELNDIIWDGSRYVMVGSCAQQTESTERLGMIAVSEDLVSFETKLDDDDNYYSRYFVIFRKDGKYILIGAAADRRNTGTGSYGKFGMYSYVGDLGEWENNTRIIDYSSKIETVKTFMDSIEIYTAEKSNEYILYIKSPDQSKSYTTSYNASIYITADGNIFRNVFYRSDVDKGKMASVFECKDSLYYFINNASYNYEFVKIISSGEKATMTTNIGFLFVDAVYFNQCEIFINDHEMLIINPKESIADKSLDDLVEITYDFSMTSIIKAFDKLYIFGTGGNVLVSSDEIKNEESLAVRTMSASKALFDAKAYTDAKCKEMQGVDLSEYVKKTDLEELTEQEIEDIWNEIFNNDEDEESGEDEDI